MASFSHLQTYLSSALLITNTFGCVEEPYTCTDGHDLTDCTISCVESQCTEPVCCDGDFYSTECDAYRSCSSTAIFLYDSSLECSESTFQCPTDGTTDIHSIQSNECCSFMFHECCIKECGDELIHGLYFESNGGSSCYYDYHDASQCDPDWLDKFTFNGTLSYEAMCRGLNQQDCLSVTMDGHAVCLYDTSFKQCYSIQGDGAYPEEDELTSQLNTETTKTQIILLVMSIIGGIIVTLLAIAGCFAAFCYYQDKKALRECREIMRQQLVSDTVIMGPDKFETIHEFDPEENEEDMDNVSARDAVDNRDEAGNHETVASESSVILTTPDEETAELNADV